MDRKTIYLIGLIIYLIIVFSIEFAYREPLYEESVEYIEKIKQEGFFHYFYLFFTFIYLVGVIVIGMIVVLLFYPINIFFCNFSFLLFSIFVMSIFKSSYASPRPYWDIFLKLKKNNLPLPKVTECDGEFGNPSGHAFLNMYILILWHLFINSNFVTKIEKDLYKKLVKYSSLVIVVICMIFCAYSRIHRQVHSFNQIIHGTLLGLSIVFFLCYIFEYHKIEMNEFINLLDRLKYIIIPIALVLYAISIIVGLTVHNSKEDEYTELLKEICGYKGGYDMFGKNTALISSIIFLPIGGYLGFLYLKYKINHSDNKELMEKIINNWNKGKILYKILIALFSFILPGLLMTPFVFIPSDYYIPKFIVFFIASFCYGFLGFGPCFCFISEKLRKSEFANQEPLTNSENNDNKE